jgi:hypothetical protein
LALAPLHSLAFSQFGGKIVFGPSIICPEAGPFKSGTPSCDPSPVVSILTVKTARYDYWLADGSPDFGLISAGVQGITDRPAPIRLQRGDPVFGAHHIESKHGHWVRKHAASAPELVWKKCRQSGLIYSTETSEKGKIWMPIQPSALMVLAYVEKENFWTVVSLYFHEGSLDGEEIGRYRDTMTDPPPMPTFSIRDLPTPPLIRYKPRRKLPGI